MESIRERIEAQEAAALSPLAALSRNSKGRARPEEPCDLRTCFQRDRDRIIHCSSFRRLKHKTQVFLAPEGDYYRTRLTHTLEVSQIARTISRAMRLNEDLTEAIALGHDLGHTPFGHAGERALNRCFADGFRHYEQSVRVVERLEKDGDGLNLTYEVLNGIVCHTKGQQADTLEGRVVGISDRIAYSNHDIDDAGRAGDLREDDIPKPLRDMLGNRISQRIDTLVRAVVQGSGEEIQMASPQAEAFEELHQFMYEHVYFNPVAKSEEGKAEEAVRRLYEYFLERPEKLSKEYRRIYQQEGAARAACDYIAGMTDRFAVHTFEELFVPKPWKSE